jgi:glycosyltransferase 2 family protein
MSQPDNSPLSSIKASKVILPSLIGLGVVAWLFYQSFDAAVFSLVKFTWNTTFWFVVAALLMVCRDLGYIIRIKVLSQGELSWLGALRIVMLWEFTSAITPSAIGGTSVAILYVNKEGIPLGKSTAMVMATSFLDELYFVLLFPLVILSLNATELFSIGGGFHFANPYVIAAFTGIGLKLAWVVLISYGLFVNPRGFKWLLLLVFKLPILRKWRPGANKTGNEIIDSSKELQKQKAGFWIKAFAATFFSWTARYFVANALFMAFFPVGNNLLLFGRQLVMWIMMLVSPTPGGSGITEFVFTRYLSDFLPVAGFSVMLALVWRIFTYYPYLVIGAFMFPKWLKDKFRKPRIVLPTGGHKN